MAWTVVVVVGAGASTRSPWGQMGTNLGGDGTAETTEGMATASVFSGTARQEIVLMALYG